MENRYLEINAINYNFESDGYEDVEKQISRQAEMLLQQIQLLTDNLSKRSEQYIKEQSQALLKKLEAVRADQALLKKYPEEFPFLYTLREREISQNNVEDDETRSNIRMNLKQTPLEDSEIVTEAQDVAEKDSQLELNVTLDEGTTFSISAAKFDKAGEDEPHMKARLNFEPNAIETLNQQRLKKIFDFCEKHGLSVYDMTLPTKDGLIDMDEKLASLTRELLDARQKENAENPGPDLESDDMKDFIAIEASAPEHTESAQASNENASDHKPETSAKAPDDHFEGLIPEQISPENTDTTPTHTPAPKTDSSKETKSKKSLEDVRQDFIDFLEKDLHKTRGLTYFERSSKFKGEKTIVFSLYDKPNPDNERLDGLNDPKNPHVYTPTYSYRLYLSQNKDNGRFVFGYATPGGKKMDDGMAGDILGVIKGTGCTHVNFSNLPNSDKPVWMIACAEKGLVPIGISITTAKAQTMVKRAREKLNDEDFIVFKYRLANQMIENAKKKCKDKNSPTYGLSPSDFNYISSLKNSYGFENFRLIYQADGGLYQTVMKKIDEGGHDSKKGAATTLGAMQTLRSVFDFYFEHQDETIGKRLDTLLEQHKITPQERQALAVLNPNIQLKDMSKESMMTVYNTLLVRQTKEMEDKIIAEYKKDDSARAHRADDIIISSTIFPIVKGNISRINTQLWQNDIDKLELPLEHTGLFYERPEEMKWKNLERKIKAEKDKEEAAKTSGQTTATPTQTTIQAPANSKSQNER